MKNQDDCVAVTSGTNITVTGMTCSGGHGLSIGSVGGKSITPLKMSRSLIPPSRTRRMGPGLRQTRGPQELCVSPPPSFTRRDFEGILTQ